MTSPFEFLLISIGRLGHNTACLNPITTHRVDIFAHGVDCAMRWLTSEPDLYDCILTGDCPVLLTNAHVVIAGESMRLFVWFMDYTKRLQSAFQDVCIDRTDLPRDLQDLTKEFLQ